MQTFLPYPDFKLSAKHLDAVRLRNQRRESMTILNGGWKHHPASVMWLNYEAALVEYTICICQEVIKRGYADNTLPKLLVMRSKYIKPWWLGIDTLHSSHRSNLLRKFPSYYSNFGWTEPNNLPYWWPC
jgi:hypothetical protein